MQSNLDRCAVLVQTAQYGEALTCLDRALEMAPHDLAILNSRAYVLNNLQRYDDAVTTCERALHIDPACIPILVNLGVALAGCHRHQDALASQDRALRIAPTNAIVLNARGRILLALGRCEEALDNCTLALAQAPSNADAANNCGLALMGLGRHTECLASFQRAFEIQPNFAEARFNAARCRLILGQYDLAWQHYDWLAKNGALEALIRHAPPPCPLWLGKDDLNGKSIMLYEPTGLGDTIHLVRYLPLLASRGATVLLCVARPLRTLMATVPRLSRVYEFGEALPRTDFYCALSLLPFAFGTTLADIPAPIPYLSVESNATASWRAKLAGDGKKLVGISWRGSTEYKADAERSVGLAQLLPILSTPAIRFVSLQKELSGAELELTKDLPDFVHPDADFTTTTEIVAAVDLVISVDTAWAHCAGAIGKPVWILMPFVPYWVWLSGREDSPWYPTARLFRQTALHQWQDVIARVATELADWTQSADRSESRR